MTKTQSVDLNQQESSNEMYFVMLQSCDFTVLISCSFPVITKHHI